MSSVSFGRYSACNFEHVLSALAGPREMGWVKDILVLSVGLYHMVNFISWIILSLHGAEPIAEEKLLISPFLR
jgi:hypothetical protein